MAGGFLKKFLPHDKNNDAVSNTKFRGYIDIRVPVASSYGDGNVKFAGMTPSGGYGRMYVR